MTTAVTEMPTATVIASVVATISRIVIGWIGVPIIRVAIIVPVITGVEAPIEAAPKASTTKPAAVKATPMEAAASTVPAPTTTAAAVGVGLAGKAQCTQAGKNEKNLFHFIPLVGCL
jgi:hypothetical protein